MIRRILHLIFVFSIFCLLSSSQKKVVTQQTTNSDSLALSRPSAGNLAPSFVDHDIIFVFSDSSGHYLIGGEPDAESNEPYYLVTPNGDTIRLKHIGYRKETDHSSHRQIAANFRNEGGNLFHTEYPSLQPDQTYIVVTGRFLEQHHPLRLMRRSYTSVDSNFIIKIGRARARRVHQSWHLASLQMG